LEFAILPKIKLGKSRLICAIDHKQRLAGFVFRARLKNQNNNDAIIRIVKVKIVYEKIDK
jgi:hypothetical protein